MSLVHSRVLNTGIGVVVFLAHILGAGTAPIGRGFAGVVGDACFDLVPKVVEACVQCGDQYP